MARAVLSVSIDFALADLVRQEAQRTGQTESAVVAEALRKHFGIGAEVEGEGENEVKIEAEMSKAGGG